MSTNILSLAQACLDNPADLDRVAVLADAMSEAPVGEIREALLHLFGAIGKYRRLFALTCPPSQLVPLDPTPTPFEPYRFENMPLPVYTNPLSVLEEEEWQPWICHPQSTIKRGAADD